MNWLRSWHMVLLVVVGCLAYQSTPTTAHPDPTATPLSPHNQEDSYSFAYAVDAPDYRNFHDREEARLGHETRGRFRVALPDNRLQTVTYTADRRGYSASITYDAHPDFESLRQAIGPIRAAPEIGQSVLEGIRRGENWKHHKNHNKDDETQTLQNIVSPTAPRRPHPNHPSPTIPSTRRRPRPSVSPRPRPTRVQPSSTPNHRRRPLPPQRQVSGPSPPQSLIESGVRAPLTTPSTATLSRPTSSGRPVSRRPTPSARPTPAASAIPTAAIFIAPEDEENAEILNRLITAIQKKLEEEGPKHELELEKVEKGDDGKSDKKYTIGDKASVLRRLAGIVHPVQFSSSHAHG